MDGVELSQAADPQQGDSLLFTSKSQGIPGNLFDWPLNGKKPS